MAHPEERTDFRHPKLHQWVESRRVDLVRAALMICQAWVAAGCPEGSATLGGFESWAAVVGGILEVAEIPGFLHNREGLYAASAAEQHAKRQFVTAWWRQFGERPVGVGELYPLLVAPAEPIDLDLGDGTERSQKTKLGKLVVGARDTIINGYQIVAAGERQNAQLWRLLRVTTELREVS